MSEIQEDWLARLQGFRPLPVNEAGPQRETDAPELNRLNRTYTERNRIAAALAHSLLGQTPTGSTGWRVGVAQHDPADENWHVDWRTILVIEHFRLGQMTWHFPLWDRHLLKGLPVWENYQYDGHTTEEKYRRLHCMAQGFTEHCAFGAPYDPDADDDDFGTRGWKPWLERCGYCGSNPSVSIVDTEGYPHYVRCPGCKAHGPVAPTKREAVNRWNQAWRN